ncbi:MAG TPA: potassium channel family protein [Silvibacterium sp.]|nr:potassium channel family protein [Silvibacterium sp.]
MPRGLTILFVKDFVRSLWLMFPLLFSLLAAIALLGQWVGRIESWSRLDSLYWSLVTATTLGYGDLRPSRAKSKVIAILIAFLGLILTGIIIAAAVQATSLALNEIRR